MSSYKYINGCYEITTDILPGYKRFRKCNAQYRVLDLDIVTVYQFISYATKILQATYYKEHDVWRIKIVDECFDYSPTTTRQIGKFLKDACIPVSSADIRNALDNCTSVTPNISTYAISDKCVIDVVSNDYLANRVWR